MQQLQHALKHEPPTPLAAGTNPAQHAQRAKRACRRQACTAPGQGEGQSPADQIAMLRACPRLGLPAVAGNLRGCTHRGRNAARCKTCWLLPTPNPSTFRLPAGAAPMVTDEHCPAAPANKELRLLPGTFRRILAAAALATRPQPDSPAQSTPAAFAAAAATFARAGSGGAAASGTTSSSSSSSSSSSDSMQE